MKFTMTEKKARQEGDYQVTRLSTVAKWFFWNKVAIDGKSYDTFDEYEKALAAAKKPEYEAACAMATKLSKAAHEKRVARDGFVAGNSRRNGLYR